MVGWRSFIEENCYRQSVLTCIGFQKSDEITLIHGWSLGNKPEEFNLVLPSRGIRILRTKEVHWKKSTIPPMRLFFKIMDDGMINLLYLEEDN